MIQSQGIYRQLIQYRTKELGVEMEVVSDLLSEKLEFEFWSPVWTLNKSLHSSMIPFPMLLAKTLFLSDSASCERWQNQSVTKITELYAKVSYILQSAI